MCREADKLSRGRGKYIYIYKFRCFGKMRMTECSKYCQKMQMGDHLTGMDPSN
jgi:hypothetical protein